MNRKLRNRILSISIVALALGAVSPAYAYSVYRRVTADAAGVVVWTAANFGVSGNPGTLSFFLFENDAAAVAGLAPAQCLVKVDWPGVAAPAAAVPPVPTPHADVGHGVHNVVGLLPFPWVIRYDNVQPGHWSIAKDAIVANASNNAAGAPAALGFQRLATTAHSGVTSGYWHSW